MLSVTDLNGNTELIAQFKNFYRGRKVNGEKTIGFIAFPTHEVNWDLIDTQSMIEFDNEEYIVKKVVEKNAGKKSIKHVEAVHRFFDDMIGYVQHDVHNGSLTFFNALSLIFDPTPYNFHIVDPFNAEAFENFGRDNCLSMFKHALNRYGAEFYVQGYNVYLMRQIGSDIDFQYRYRHNVKVIDKEISTLNLASNFSPI